MSMNTKQKGVVNFLIYRDKGDSMYTAVCLTFDIIEKGNNPEELRKSIEEAASLHLETVIVNGLDDSLLNRSAPQKYWKKLYEAMVAYEEFAKDQKPSVQETPDVSDIWNRKSRELCEA